MRRFICAALAALYLTIPALAVETLPEESFSLSCTAAVLMERQTGTVLYEKEAHRHLSPASVTKVMTLLLTMEAIDSGALSYDDTVTGSAHAASMGGSQIWLKEGEQMR
ncbi:MAG TPA: D-alanyl-D-alanine carboxypeptidase, partial [Clostridiales bacterium]|nr:D-alanyl-D-alanine carboxypeptidase [Clostridiales bacterium]